MRYIIAVSSLLFLVIVVSGCTSWGITEEDKANITYTINEYFENKNLNSTERGKLEVGESFYEYIPVDREDLEIVSSWSDEVTVRANVSTNILKVFDKGSSRYITVTSSHLIDQGSEIWEFKLKKENETWIIVSAKPIKTNP